jgi:uncharacterized repeat protein (TIGR04138 family)
MSLRDELTRVIAKDPRYALDAYAFVLQSLDYARHQKLKGGRDKRGALLEGSPKPRSRGASARSSKTRESGHVMGQDLCDAVRKLALREYGLLAALVFGHWGVYSTSDIGEIVYNLIAAGDLEKTPTDTRSDFDNVFDFDRVLRPPVTPCGGEGRQPD